jgi:hypothetical protein
MQACPLFLRVFLCNFPQFPGKTVGVSELGSKKTQRDVRQILYFKFNYIYISVYKIKSIQMPFYHSNIKATKVRESKIDQL